MRINIDKRRIRILKDAPVVSGPVIYWMSRDQRVGDNWALLYAQQLASELKSPLAVVFCLVPEFLGATIRQYGFMLECLKQAEAQFRKLNIPFHLLTGSPEGEIVRFLQELKAAALVADFSPLRISRNWKTQVAEKIKIPFYEVDAHNIIPAWTVSKKREFAAYTLRPKINRLLPEFLTEFPTLSKHKYGWPVAIEKTDWNQAKRNLKVDRSVPEVNWLKAGEKAAGDILMRFLKRRLSMYDANRNDPTIDAQSMLSPYLHFGQISAQSVALQTQRFDNNVKAQEVFLEELIVRRELADNFCLYNLNYDSFDGFPEWARKTLNEHRSDPREYISSAEQFELAETHDDLWNAAQMEMVKTGKMHGYMRMYWAKKILEWTASPEQALQTAIYLNDKYELDGRDPGGYTGVAWSIGGVHDRPWFEREIFGKIRYMSHGGCKRKFNIAQYIENVSKL